jgi:DNA-binding transcriptional LysR family regulator
MIGISPPVLTVGSNGAIRESVRVGLGVTLISRDAVRRELEEGTLQEWRCPGLPLERTWHAVAVADDATQGPARRFSDLLILSIIGGLTLLAAVYTLAPRLLGDS